VSCPTCDEPADPWPWWVTVVLTAVCAGGMVALAAAGHWWGFGAPLVGWIACMAQLGAWAREAAHRRG
jgi:hypothetical protein